MIYQEEEEDKAGHSQYEAGQKHCVHNQVGLEGRKNDFLFLGKVTFFFRKV